jgi:hypothetical protein
LQASFSALQKRMPFIASPAENSAVFIGWLAVAECHTLALNVGMFGASPICSGGSLSSQVFACIVAGLVFLAR